MGSRLPRSPAGRIFFFCCKDRKRDDKSEHALYRDDPEHAEDPKQTHMTTSLCHLEYSDLLLKEQDLIAYESNKTATDAVTVVATTNDRV